ncbi:MAG TPA: hypothetical protein DDX85_08725, partial [Nitrospiraceae bacterium]|nr:hypothetical protein [Nitrospiraceae bacterium]
MELGLSAPAQSGAKFTNSTIYDPFHLLMITIAIIWGNLISSSPTSLPPLFIIRYLLVGVGQEASFMVQADGTAPLSYQWYFNT